MFKEHNLQITDLDLKAIFIIMMGNKLEHK